MNLFYVSIFYHFITQLNVNQQFVEIQLKKRNSNAKKLDLEFDLVEF